MTLSDFLFKHGIIENRHAKVLDKLLIILLALLPFFFMTVRDIFGAITVFILIVSILLLWAEPEARAKISRMDGHWLLVAALALPPLSVLITEVLRGDVHAGSYDGPIRLLLLLPVYFAVFLRKIHYWKLLPLVLPLALVVVWIYAGFDAQSAAKFGDRLSVHYVDPIVWGNFAILQGFLCLYCIRNEDGLLKKAYLFCALLVGISMSILSQSRGGWVASVVLLYFWLGAKERPAGWRQVVLTTCGVALFLVATYFSLDIFHRRIDGIYEEIHDWITAKHTFTSSGLRLSMWEISLHLFQLRPFAGFGDHGLLPYLNDPYVQATFDHEAILMIQGAGPHNELLAELLRSGVFGLASYVGKYLIPLYLFGRLYFKNRRHNPPALLGMGLIIGCIISGWSIEVLSFKLVYTYYAVTILALMGNAMLIDAAAKDQPKDEYNEVKTALAS